MDKTDKERQRVWDFSSEVLDDAEAELKESFKDNPYAEEAMHMTIVDLLSFRLLCSGNWEKEELKQWISERIENAATNLIEFEREEQGVSLHSLH